MSLQQKRWEARVEAEKRKQNAVQAQRAKAARLDQQRWNARVQAHVRSGGKIPSPVVRSQSSTPATTSSSSSSDRPPAPTHTPAPTQQKRRRRRRRTRWDDATYYAQIASLNRALQDFETGLQSRAQRYGQDFTRGVRDLGFRAGEDFNAAPDILGFRDLAEGLAAVRRPQRPMARGMIAEGEEAQPMSAAEMMGGTWDFEGEYNPFSAAARGTRSSRDEFAGRGTLRSSDFVQNFAEFQDRLNQQLEAMETGRRRFFEDALTNLAQQRATTEERRQAARRDAVMRAAMIDASRR